MVTDAKPEKKAFWWTTIIVTISTTIIGTGLRMLTGAVDNSMQEPSYFPLLYLLVAFFSTLLLMLVYQKLLPQLPSSWIIQGFLVGLFVFVIGDFPFALIIGYQTRLAVAIARGMFLAQLVNRVINGWIMTYSYNRLSVPRDN